MWKDWATDRAKDEFDIMHRYVSQTHAGKTNHV